MEDIKQELKIKKEGKVWQIQLMNKELQMMTFKRRLVKRKEKSLMIDFMI